MSSLSDRAAQLEWANYAATLPMARVTPGLELVLRDDVILTASSILPLPDANHACCLRTVPQRADALIEEILSYYRTRERLPTVYVSPACVPAGLVARLTARGFVPQPQAEAWMTLDDVLHYDVPLPTQRTYVQRITVHEVQSFAEIFLASFGMPASFAPAMIQLLGPSMGLDHVYHYMAYSGSRSSKSTPVGTCSLLIHETFAVLGSVGVIRSRHSRGAATNMVIAALLEAQRQGVTTVMLQTVAGTRLERFLRIYGFRRAFTRTCYVLDEDGTD